MSSSSTSPSSASPSPPAPAAQTYAGGCHCGAVRFSVTMPPPTQAMACNCSLCSRMGWRLAFVSGAQFVLVEGSDALVDYQFAKKHIHHVFCGTCGIRSFGHGPAPHGDEMVAVNLRCVEGIDVEALELNWYDGASV